MKSHILVACLVLAACGEQTHREEAAVTRERDSVFDPMTDQIDKAKVVEDAALKHKQDIDDALRAIEESPRKSKNDL